MYTAILTLPITLHTQVWDAGLVLSQYLAARTDLIGQGPPIPFQTLPLPLLLTLPLPLPPPLLLPLPLTLPLLLPLLLLLALLLPLTLNLIP